MWLGISGSRQKPIEPMRTQRLLRRLLWVAFLWSGAAGGYAQTLVNNGAHLTLAPGILVVVNGDFLQTSGTTTVGTTATLKVSGNVTIFSGQLQLQGDASMTVTGNMDIGPSATVDRAASGMLEVHGTLNNQGTVTNHGTVEVGPP